MIRPALRYHGAKWRLAPWILAHMPPHACYVEPFGGAAGVLLRKPRSYAEVYNDLDGEIVNFFRVLRDPETRAQLIEQVALTPYAREEFRQSWAPCEDSVERARRLCIRAQMGFGSAGATKGATGFRADTKRHRGTVQYDWARYPDALAAVGERFTGVLIENRPALDVMAAHDGVDTMHYVDPPYVHSTRGKGSHRNRYYRHELSDDDHRELLAALRRLDGMVMVSGYETALYHDTLVGWRVERSRASISAGRGTGIRTEVLWMNPACAARSGWLFGGEMPVHAGDSIYRASA